MRYSTCMLVKSQVMTKLFLPGAAATAIAGAVMTGTAATSLADPANCVDANLMASSAMSLPPVSKEPQGPGGVVGTAPGVEGVAGPSGVTGTAPGVEGTAGPGGVVGIAPGVEGVAGPGGVDGCVNGVGCLDIPTG